MSRHAAWSISDRLRFRFETSVLLLRFSAMNRALLVCVRHCSLLRHSKRALDESRAVGLFQMIGLLMMSSLMTDSRHIHFRECGESCATSHRLFRLNRRSEIRRDLSYHKMTPNKALRATAAVLCGPKSVERQVDHAIGYSMDSSPASCCK